MHKTSFSRLAGAVFAVLLWGHCTAISAEPEMAELIVIGDLGSFTTLASYATPYKMAVDLAVEEVNASGGVLGRQFKIARRDDHGRPEDVVRSVAELSSLSDSVVITGFMLSPLTLASSVWCEKERVPCIAVYAVADKLLRDNWNPWMFRIAASSTVLARVMAAEAAPLSFKRLAIASAQAEGPASLTQEFKRELKRLSPQVEIVGEQWSPFYKLDAGPVVSVLNYYKPDAIFASHVGSDQTKIVRDGNKRGLFTNRVVIMPKTGTRQDVGDLLKEVPAGWITLCHSPSQITIPAYAPFRKAYLAKYNKEPDEASVYGYSVIYAIKAAIEKAGNTDRTAVRDALEGLTWGTPLGEVMFRKFDHQSNMPFFYGKTVGDGSGLPLCNEMKQADPWMYWPRPDDDLPEVLRARMIANDGKNP